LSSSVKKPWAKPNGIKSCLKLRALSSIAQCCRYDGELGLKSRAISNTEPFKTLISLAWSKGGFWKWRPLKVYLFFENERFSCTNVSEMPISSKRFFLYVSEKKPRLSSCLYGVSSQTEWFKCQVCWKFIIKFF